MHLQREMFERVLLTPGHLVSVAARRFARLSEARLKPYGFGVGQLPVLVALEQGLADTQRDLARMAGTKQPPMAQMLARMTRDDLVESVPDAADGRVTRLILTDKARKRMPAAVAALFEGNREATAGFSEEEVATLLDMLRRLAANIAEINGDMD
jgi:MarR family transcriptional regulator for hemolysin